MAYIKREIVDKILDVSDITEVISDYVDLTKKGSDFQGLSPFVDEKTPSFMVSPSKGIWKDFSSDKGGSTAVKFLMEKENISFPDAIKLLAKKYSIDIEYDNSQNAKEYLELEQKKESLRQLLELVISKYEEKFQKLPKEHPAKIEAFKNRKYSAETIDKYRIGYAPGGTFIYDFCVQNGRRQDAIDLGLINENNDKWHDRIIYPLIAKKGTSLLPVGLAGRRLNENKKYAKWLNSCESTIYKKDEFWYGLEKSKTEIANREEVWLVEGYNDVIAWQENGIPNTIASCGTAISKKQIQVLKKYCKKVIFCFDPDGAGKKAMLKHIPQFISCGFRVWTVKLEGNLDPDDFVRYHAEKKLKYSITDLGLNNDFREDGFKILMLEKFKDKDEVAIAQEAKNLTSIIFNIEDEGMKEIYTRWLVKESNINKTQINSWLKNLKNEEPSAKNDEFYLLPSGIKESLDKLRPTIEKYQLFISNNQIWVREKDNPPHTFRSVSNFSIEIMTHMQDEKFPMKLVRIKNIYGLERIFDMQSSDMNTKQSFENAVTAHGNFRWKGGVKEHELLKTYLFDLMGTGRKIDVLGWQPEEKFWVWNNKITVPGENDIIVDKNGVFEKDGISYYLPSANSIYRTNFYKYEAQKKVVSLPASISFHNYTTQVIKVHREHGITAILFSVASIFQDFVADELDSFPMLFLIGRPSSGKDQLADVCQSFFGLSQTAINLEGGVSTIKAQVREFAQFSNTISELSEYKNGDPKLDGVLKGLWDRNGYKRGNIDSHVGTESIPILSSVVMTGNYAPEQPSLITRLIWEFMDKTEFNDSEIKEYEKLSDMTKRGISSFTDDFLHHRSYVVQNFQRKFREFKSTLGQRKAEANSRMITNLAVLGAFYQIFKDQFDFAFTHEEMMSHFEETIDKQMRKMNSASILNRFWDCFLASMRGTVSDQIRVGRDFKITGIKLYFNFTNCYNRVSRQWFSQYRDSAPAKSEMMESLKKDESWISDIKATRMGKGKKSKSTSAYIVNVNELPIKDEIKAAIEFQLKESGIPYPDMNESEAETEDFDYSPGEKNNNIRPDLPF